jgi:transaldolase
MKYFLDSAKLDEIDIAYKQFAIDGVTTNPRHVMLSGKSCNQVMKDIAAWINDNKLNGVERFPVSVEIDPFLTKAQEMVAEAKLIAAICANFVIKVPCTAEGVLAARLLEAQGIKTNVTLVFSPAQALWPAKTKAAFVSPFIGWKEDGGEDTRQYIQDIVQIYKNYGFYGKTQIICAAIRTPKQMVDCAVAGADIVTAGLAVYQESFNHAYTQKGLKIFCDAWEQTAKD